MKKKILILMMIVCLGSTFYGCGYNGSEGNSGAQSDNSGSDNSGSDNNASTDTSGNSAGENNQSEGDDAINNADLFGSVIDFSETGCTLGKGDISEEQQTVTAEGASADNEDQISVIYGDDITFQIAVSSMTDITLEPGSKEDVKKSSNVYIYGKKQEDGTFLASRVLIERFQG